MALLAQADPVQWSQWGVLGGLIFVIVTGCGVLKYLMDKHREDWKLLTEEMKDGFREVKDGFQTINETIKERDRQVQGIIDKHLEVTIKVTEGMGRMGTEVAQNTREIGELKSELRQLRTKEPKP